ncbi:MAG: hypothetical protein K1X29_02870 [Bdellovibrionales bacterium]|nr:hypothetical protein [Bdellovibrionales bacterium]
MEQLDPLKKARSINMDSSFYGTFAEIGAGQEVARYFFLAGRASQTVAKSISAYDMKVSDSIYGKSNRYVCQERILQMLDHEYGLLVERLSEQRGEKTRFFAFADTVATSSHGEPDARCHGWMGIRYQTYFQGPPHEIILHIRLKDRFRLQQQEALGILGVNLIHLSYSFPRTLTEIVKCLVHNLGHERLEINFIRCQGSENSWIDHRLLNLELVKQGVAEAVLFDEKGHIQNASDLLFRQPVLVQRGTFRPVTKTNLTLLEKGMEQFQSQFQQTPQVLFELTMHELTAEGELSHKDFLDRVDTLLTLGHKVLLTHFKLSYQVKSYLRSHTDQVIGLIVGADQLDRLFDSQHYQHLPGGILEGFSRLYDEKTKILVFPFKSEQMCLTASTFHPTGSLKHLYQYFIQQKLITDILGCEDVDTSIHSQDVRLMLKSGDPKWEELVPPPVRDLIKKQGLFGAKL